MEVKILNPEVLTNLYQNHGLFACVCYDTPDKYAEKVGESCEDSGHMSGSRCEYIKFRVTGLDRGTSEQALRHEIGTSVPFEDQDNYFFSDYSERIIDVSPNDIVKNMASFRYIDKSGFDYSTPDTIVKCSYANEVYKSIMEYINDGREKIKNILIDNGVDTHRAVQDANFVLPRATETSFTIGFTPEALIHFEHKRQCVRAQEFINELARLMKDECAKYNPKYASELVPHCKYLLWCPEGKHSCHAAYTRDELAAVIEDYKTLFKGFKREEVVKMIAEFREKHDSN